MAIQQRVVEVTDLNQNCTANAPRKYIAPLGWNGQLGDAFDPVTAVAQGWVEDTGGAQFSLAVACVEGGGGQ